jgi:diguanylate cyclase (GGDEF)-like protein
MERQIRLLIVDDQPADAEIAARLLKQAGYHCVWERVDTEQSFRERLHGFQPHLIFSDFSMPRFDGLSALEIAASVAPDTPFIFVSGSLGEKRAVQALKLGAFDCVPKHDLSRLAPAVARVMTDSMVPGSDSNPAERMRRLSGALQMLSALRAASREIHTRGALLEEACHIIHLSQQYRYAFVALANPHTRIAHTVAWTGAGAARGEEASFHVAHAPGLDESSVSFVLRTGEPNVCFDLHDYRGPLAAVERRGAQIAGSFLCLPLLVEGRAIGALTLGGIRNAMVSEQELLLLDEFAGELSEALRALPDEAAVPPHPVLERLTQLNRRETFCEHVAQLLKKATPDSAPLTVAVFDIERLRDINVSFGRHAGDRLVKSVAERLKRRFGGTADVGAFGGGTFAAVFSLPPSPAVDIERASTETQRIPHIQAPVSGHDATSAVFGHPFAIGDHSIPVTVKCGLARFPLNGGDAETLAQFAEAALQKLRERRADSRPAIRLPHISEMAPAELERRLRRALDMQHFVLRYQPQFGRTGTICGVEALLRWDDPDRGTVSPAAFLPALESSGLIVPLGEWVLKRATADWRRWQGLGLPPLRLALNVSGLELLRPDFAPRFLDAMGLHGKARCLLDLEIAEGVLLSEPQTARRCLAQLRAEGVQVAIDDFGMGVGTLRRLRELPVDVLKIDRAFVNQLTPDAQSQAVVSTIVSLARAYGLETVAEGVETRQQLRILHSLGCDRSQGFLHSPPLTADELESLLGSLMTYAS